MPILAENRDRYPADWPAISDRIRFGRAHGRCECRGECGLRHGGAGDRCEAPHGKRICWHRFQRGHWGIERGTPGGEEVGVTGGTIGWATGVRIVLTVGHLNHQPEDCRDENLRAWCQRCHNRYARAHRNATRATRALAAERSAGQLVLPVELLP